MLTPLFFSYSFLYLSGVGAEALRASYSEQVYNPGVHLGCGQDSISGIIL